MKLLVCIVTLIAISACSATNVATAPSQLGVPGNLEGLSRSMQQPGVIEFQKHISADWAVNLSGLVNLEHEKAKAANLEDRLEPIQIYTYQITHPTQGTFLIDSGVSTSFIEPDTNEDVSFIVKMAMGFEHLKVHQTTKALTDQISGVDGVFLTHIHLDHIIGLRDLDSSVPVFIGPGDAGARAFTHAATLGTTNNLLANVEKLQEWDFSSSEYLDIFGDGSLWAIHSPGHTPGATAYLVNSTSGPELILGDVTHTTWGWKNGVEPGTFSADQPASAISLKKLVKLAETHPSMNVHPGHQPL